MALEITGKLLVKGEAQQVSEKFKKREFVVELVEEINGNVYTNFGKFQLVQAKCDILDRFSTGDAVKVHFNIKGNSYIDKKDGTTKYITNLDAWKIEGVQQTYQPTAQQPVHSYTGPSQVPGSQAASNVGPAPHAPGEQVPDDDLPF